MPAYSDPARLKEFALFAQLTPEQLAQTNASLRRIPVREKERLIHATQSGDSVYLIEDGTFKVCAPGDADDDEDRPDVILALLGQGETVGEMSVLDSLDRSADVIALEDSHVLQIARSDFAALLESSPALAAALAALLSRRVRMANATIRALSTLDVRGGVARALLTMMTEWGEPVDKSLGGGTRIPFRLTQNELAGMVGATRVRVNQVLQYWFDNNTLTHDPSRRLVVKNPEALRKHLR
jgi:CRP/FNR family cyclic AMP-dependent transcriptional regulator